MSDPSDPGHWKGAPDSIAQYRISRELGRGGQGTVYLTGRDRQRVDEAAAALARDGLQVIPRVCDVRDDEAVHGLARWIAAGPQHDPREPPAHLGGASKRSEAFPASHVHAIGHGRIESHGDVHGRSRPRVRSEGHHGQRG